MCETPARQNQAERVVGHFSQADRFLSVGDSFIELATLGEGQRPIVMGSRGGNLGQGQAPTTEIAGKRLHDRAAQVLGPPILAQGETGHPEVEVRGDLERAQDAEIERVRKPTVARGSTSDKGVLAQARCGVGPGRPAPHGGLLGW